MGRATHGKVNGPVDFNAPIFSEASPVEAAGGTGRAAEERVRCRVDFRGIFEKKEGGFPRQKSGQSAPSCVWRSLRVVDEKKEREIPRCADCDRDDCVFVGEARHEGGGWHAPWKLRASGQRYTEELRGALGAVARWPLSEWRYQVNEKRSG